MSNLRLALAAGVLLASSSARAADPSLVAHWSFDEGTGTTARDGSGRGNHGTISGAAWTDGLVGRALRFDGATSSVRVPSSPSLNVSTGLTIEAWVKLASNGGARVIVSKWDDVNQQWSYIFKKHNAADGLRIELSQSVHNDLADLAGAEPLPLGRWLHVATTYDGQTVRLFLNGREDASAARPGVVHASLSDLLIGAVNPGNASEVFDGVIDEVSIFSRALSAGELAVRYRALLPLLEAPFFQDGFDGPALDASAWSTENATSGVRWCSTTIDWHLTNPGVWLDPSVQPCNGWFTWSPPVWGQVTFADGVASLASAWVPAFPYLVRGAPAPGAAFPAAGDFRLDLRLRYDSIQGHGTGVVVERWPDTTPAGNNPAIPADAVVFSIWADASTYAPRWGVAGTHGGAVADAPYGFHDYILEYRDGAYAARIDRGAFTPPVASAVRADTLWLGNPVITWWGIGDWTDLSVDSVAVVALPLLAGIDLKPGSYPNGVKLSAGGVVPVAILGSAALDVRQVVVGSIRLASAPVAVKDGQQQGTYLDVNGDGVLDLVVQVPASALALGAGDEVAIVQAALADGRLLRGADTVKVLP